MTDPTLPAQLAAARERGDGPEAARLERAVAAQVAPPRAMLEVLEDARRILDDPVGRQPSYGIRPPDRPDGLDNALRLEDLVGPHHADSLLDNLASFARAERMAPALRRREAFLHWLFINYPAASTLLMGAIAAGERRAA